MHWAPSACHTRFRNRPWSEIRGAMASSRCPYQNNLRKYEGNRSAFSCSDVRHVAQVSKWRSNVFKTQPTVLKINALWRRRLWSSWLMYEELISKTFAFALIWSAWIAYLIPSWKFQLTNEYTCFLKGIHYLIFWSQWLRTMCLSTQCNDVKFSAFNSSIILHSLFSV